MPYGILPLPSGWEGFRDSWLTSITGAALNEGYADLASAQSAQTFFNWVRDAWDEPGDNIYVWDFYALETAGSAPYLNPACLNAASPAHPTDALGQTVAPYIAQRIVDVFEGRGDTGSITGH